MKTKIAMLQALTLALALVLAGTAVNAAAAEPEPQEIQLRDGKTLHGVIRQIRSSLYLVQTDQELYELSAEEIASVGGQPGVPPQENVTPLFPTMHRVVLRTDGVEEMWTAEEITNNHDQILTYAMFGANERELPSMRTMQAFDQFGNRLNVRIEPRAGTDLYNVFIDFVVPILPGETMRGSLRLEDPDGIVCKDGKCVNSFWGDFPEDRLLTRRVELPVGAKLLKVEPEPNLKYEHLGQTVVVWRRYYPARTGFPLVVEYEPAGD
ncbi:MAG: hypothetical protein AB7V45_12695 [Candidatus Krumholzibacteriia bacterium]